MTSRFITSMFQIQTSAFILLVRYYPWPLKTNLQTPYTLCCHLLEEALKLCDSPKGHDSESGAALCKLVFQKWVVSHVKWSLSQSIRQYHSLYANTFTCITQEYFQNKTKTHIFPQILHIYINFVFSPMVINRYICLFGNYYNMPHKFIMLHLLMC